MKDPGMSYQCFQIKHSAEIEESWQLSNPCNIKKIRSWETDVSFNRKTNKFLSDYISPWGCNCTLLEFNRALPGNWIMMGVFLVFFNATLLQLI